MFDVLTVTFPFFALVLAGYVAARRRLLALEALPRGSILAHGVHLSGDEVKLADETGLWLVQNPRSNESNGVGYPAALRDTRDYYQQDIRYIIVATLIVVMLILMVLLRAIVAPLYLVASVVVSYFAAIGIGVCVFQFLLGQELHWSVPPLAFDGRTLRLVRRVDDGVQLVAWSLTGSTWQRWTSAPLWSPPACTMRLWE